MTNISVSFKNHSIEISKKFAKAASRVGSEEYDLLQSTRKDYPNYAVIVKSTVAKKKENFKGLTYGYMEQYINDHDNEDKSIMKKFMTMRGTSEEAREALANSKSYPVIKKWFLETFPEIKKFYNDRENLLKNEDYTGNKNTKAES